MPGLMLVLVQLPGKLPLSKPSLKITLEVLLPVPLRATDCGLFPALSLMLTLALRVPVVVGVKVTLMLQEAPAVSVLGLMGQVLVWAKSPALVPPRLIVEIVRSALPLLVRVTVCAALVVPTFWLPKLRLLGLRLTAGAGVTPVPLSVTDCGLSPALSLMLTLALRAPVTLGVKVTLIVQLLPAGNVLGLMGQVLVCAKSPALVPATLIVVIVRSAVPLLVSVTVCAALVVLTF